MVKDKSKPKRALTPYAVFVQSMRDEHKKKNPSSSIDFSAFSKECSAKWKVCFLYMHICVQSLSAKEKKKYEDIAAKDKERYQKAMKNYTPSASDDKKKKQKDPNAPKKPMSAFFLFCRDERPKVREAHPDWSVGQCAKELASRWEQCKSKSKYETQASQEKAKYQKAMEKYNAKKGDESSQFFKVKQSFFQCILYQGPIICVGVWSNFTLHVMYIFDVYWCYKDFLYACTLSEI